MPRAGALGVNDVQAIAEGLFKLDGRAEGDEYRFLCPNPQHLDSDPSCSVNLDSGYWHCFVCGVGGDFAALGCITLGKQREEVLELLKPASVEGLVHVVRNKLAAINSRTKRPEPPPPLGGPYEPGPLSSLRARGFELPTLRKWGVRFCEEQELIGHKGPFTIRNSIAIPIKDENGTLLAWCYRRTDSSPPWQPRYLYDREVSHLWFGMDQHPSGDVCIVEGALDDIWLDQQDIPGLGLLGAGMAGGKRSLQSKVSRLQRYKSIILIGDRDSGGEAWVRLIGNALGERMPVWVATYSSWMYGRDPQELPGLDLELMIVRAKPWSRWRMR